MNDSATSSLCSSAASGGSTAVEGERVAVLGRLLGGVRGDVARILREHGGELVPADDSRATLLVLGDGATDLESALARLSDDVATAVHAAVREQCLAVIDESTLWQRLGLVDDCEVRRLYTPAMLAELLDVPAAAIRHWQRRDLLRPACTVGRLAYFDFQETAVARRLAELLKAGCSLGAIERQAAELSRQAPDRERPMTDPSVVIVGRQMMLRRGEDLAEPGGQLVLDFDAEPLDADSLVAPAILSIPAAETRDARRLLEELEEDALCAVDEGDLTRAVECYRTILLAGGAQPEIHFALADVLYRLGELGAARERLYAALEIDEEYVEARTSLGCVLAELGELELAAATFAGALAYHADFADAHYHLANTLDRLERYDEAAHHFREFLALAPESPWAEAARSRLDEFRPSILASEAP